MPDIPPHPSTTYILYPEDKRWQNAVYAGFMTKEGSFFRSWRKRFFILNANGDLYYFKKREVCVENRMSKIHLCNVTF